MEDRQTDDPPFCVARKIPYFLSIHIGGTVQYKEASARGIIIPLQSLGPASRQGILAKTWSTLNLGTSQNSSSTHFVNEGEIRKRPTLVNSSQQRSKDRHRESPQLEAFLGPGLSLAFLFNAAAPLLLLISPTGGGRCLSTNCSPRKAYSRP
jgi:hypothetical protein